MLSSELDGVLSASGMEALEEAGEHALQPLGAYRLEIDDQVILAAGDGALPHQTELRSLPGSRVCLSSQHPAASQALVVAAAVANTHLRLALRDELEARVLLTDRHMDAVDRTVGFLGELDEEKARIGILNACMDVVDASVGVVLERGMSGWRVSVDLGLPGDALIPYMEREEGTELAIRVLREGLRVLFVPMGASGGVPVLVVLADWSLADAESLAVLRTVSRLGRVALENANLVRVAAERQRLQIELTMAGRTQELLMPTETPDWPGLEIVGFSRPSADCGGDYFDWFPIEGRGFVLCVADVSGHGIGAAIVMATLRGYLTAALRHREALDLTLASVCQMLCDFLEPWQFVTVFLAEVSHDGGTLSFCNAGHEPGLLIRAQGSVERLEADAPPLGIDPALTPGVQSTVFLPNDMLVIPTDGMAEAENTSNIQIGRDVFEEWVVRVVRESSNVGEVKDALLAAVAQHRGGAQQSDDETLVVMRRVGRKG